jgi:KAP family P-loop domain
MDRILWAPRIEGASDMKLNLIADHAIGESALRSVEGLGFAAYADVLAEVARDTRGPFTIGVFGEWGSGKTSLMHLVERRCPAPVPRKFLMDLLGPLPQVLTRACTRDWGPSQPSGQENSGHRTG